MSESSGSTGGMDELDATFVEVTQDGDVVSETVTAITDEDSGVTAVDDIVAVESADGSVLVDETVSSAIDADGNSTIVSESVANMTPRVTSSAIAATDDE